MKSLLCLLLGVLTFGPPVLVPPNRGEPLPQQISWQATVLAAPEINTQPTGVPEGCPPIVSVNLTVSIQGNPDPLRATCTPDAGHEAHCLCAGLSVGDVVRIEALSLNHFTTYPGTSGISVYWPEIDRISVVSLVE